MRLLFFVLITGLLVACTNGNTVPAGIIPRQKMETILWQLMQSDEYINTQLAKDSLKKPGTAKMKIYQQVFDLNGTSLDEFKKSYQYYMAHPDITKIMFDSITARAARLRTDIYKPKPPAVNLQADSLKFRPAALKVRPDSLRHGAARVVLPAGKPALKPDTVKPKSKKSKNRRSRKTVKKP